MITILLFAIFLFLAFCGVRWISSVAKRPEVVKDRRCDRAVRASAAVAQEVELALIQRVKRK